MKFLPALLLLVTATTVDAFGESLPWIETFSGLSNGDVHDNGVTSWTAERSTGIFHIENGRLKINDGNTIGTLETGWIDVSNTGTLKFSAYFSEPSSNLKDEDYVDFDVRLPNGTLIDIGYVQNDYTGMFMERLVETTDFDSVKIEIKAFVNHANDIMYIHNISVTEVLTAPVVAEPSGGLLAAETCTVKLFNNQYRVYDAAGDGSGLCPTGHECSYHLDTDATIQELPDIVYGTCEQTACKTNNKNPGDGSHRLTICHRTCSRTNPWVRITIDKNGWAGEEMCGHGVQHDIRVECSGKSPWTEWGGNYTDYIIKDHGIKKNLCPTMGWCDANGRYVGDGRNLEKAYWKYWEPACPYVRNGACCDWDKGECCGKPTTTPGGGGGDPHIKRWNRKTFPFHGECDLVMVHSDRFHNGAGFDLHIRTTMKTWYSVIESLALRVGDYIVEMHSEYIYVDGHEYKDEDLPVTFGGDFKYTISAPVMVTEGRHAGARHYTVDLHQDSHMIVKVYQDFLFVTVNGHENDFGDATGLLGDYYLGKMHNREGERVYVDFDNFAFEWQVRPEVDGLLFQAAREPQYPQQCNMPSEVRTSRHLRSNNKALFEKAQEACASASEVEACIDDVVATGDMAFAELW